MKAYIHNGNYIKHMKTKHPEKAARPGFEHVRLNIDMEVDEMEADEIDIDDLLPAGTPILIDKIEYHPDGPKPVDDSSADLMGGHR